jgi:uncharacterized protein (TIGR02217 family)
VTTAVDVGRNPGAYDVRRQRRSETMRKADISYQVRNIEDVYEVLSHFEVAEGPIHTFPVLDRLDWKSCAPDEEPKSDDVILGDGDGGTSSFQLRKKYIRGSNEKYRTIYCPIEESVLVAVDGVSQVLTTDFTVDTEFGTIDFEPGSIPGTGSVVTAGFKFYLKCRFDTNDLSKFYEGFRVGQVQSVVLVEVRE